MDIIGRIYILITSGSERVNLHEHLPAEFLLPCSFSVSETYLGLV